MPGMTRNYRRKPIVRRRRFFKKYGRTGRRTGPPRAVASRLNIHHFKRTIKYSDLSWSSAGAVGGSYVPQFGQLPNVSELTSLFDMYRVNKIVIKLIPNATSSDVNPSATFNGLPNFHSVLDYDDSTAPTNLDELLQYPNYKMTRGNRIHTRSFVPAIAMDLGGNIGYALKRKLWVNCANTTIPLYGMKYWFEAAGASVGKYEVLVTMYFSCKGVR